MVQVGCTINYDRTGLWKARKKSAQKYRALTISSGSARILEVVRNGQLVVVSSQVGLWRSWERASMAWKRSPVRSRPGPPYFQVLTDTPLFSWCQNALTSSKLRSGQPLVHHACFPLPNRCRSLPQLLIDGIDPGILTHLWGKKSRTSEFRQVFRCGSVATQKCNGNYQYKDQQTQQTKFNHRRVENGA